MTRRILTSYLTLTVFILLILEVPLALVYGARETERFGDAVGQDAAVLATYFEDDLQNSTSPTTTAADAYARRTNSRVVVVDTEGISVVDTAEAASRDFSTRPEIITALRGARAIGDRHSSTLDTDLLYVALPVASNGAVYGAVRITADYQVVTDRIHRFWIGLAGIAAIVIALVAAVGWALARSVTRPVRELRAAANRFAHGHLEPETGAHRGPHELRELGETMNTMASRLDELLRAQRSFVADASHQLRTPLTSMRLRLENLESTSDPAHATEVSSIILETDRLTALVNDLLQLARAEALPAATHVRIDLLIRERAETWSAVAEERNVLLAVDAPPREVWVTAVPGAIEQVLDNLLDNAISASPHGSVIDLILAVEKSNTTLAIRDHGPGMTAEQQARAMERFWRGSTTGQGSGLGLAIVAALAEASGGTAWLSDSPGGGLTVTVSLPTANATPSAGRNL